jgi:hypothetical protein
MRSLLRFTSIKLKEFVEKYVKSNSGTSRKEITAGLQAALRDYKSGVKCDCGNPIWVIGSAVVGNGCFTCITGEAVPDSDYEIDVACQE